MKIREAREELGMTIRQFAEHVHVSTSTLWRVENGYAVSGRLRRRILQGLNMTEDELTPVPPPELRTRVIRERAVNTITLQTLTTTGYFKEKPLANNVEEFITSNSFRRMYQLSTQNCKYIENRMPDQLHFVDNVGTYIVYMDGALTGYQTPKHEAVMWLVLGASLEKYEYMREKFDELYHIWWEN